MPEVNKTIQGLTEEQVLSARQQFGKNILQFKEENGLLAVIIRTLKEPMMLLLFTATVIYFINRKFGDGLFLAGAIIFQTSISLFQFSRSKKSLDQLKEFSQPKCKVIRGGKQEEINSEELVVGDCLMVEEGAAITADGTIIQANDFSVNESILTGESMAVYKNEASEENKIYAGTTVSSGLAFATISAIGNATKLGKIGKSIEDIEEEKTPLEMQISNFVKKMAIVGVIVFVIVWGINFWNSHSVLNSLLQALTLAMSILPEEIPVAFTTFMALGAWRLMKLGIVVKQMKTVETLGSATVICTDKTGTLTENKMTVAQLYLFENKQFVQPEGQVSAAEQALISTAMWASEPIPFDPMDLAMHQSYATFIAKDERQEYKLVHEYPLGGNPPMMTHVFENKSGHRIIAAKGAPEALVNVSHLSDVQRQTVHEAMEQMAKEGYRVLGVGIASDVNQPFPEKQEEIVFHFLGLVAFYDPPKKNIHLVLKHFYDAGIAVKIITGDNAATTIAIAKQVGFKGYDQSIGGDDLMQLSDAELKTRVMDMQVFTRMFPEAKLKVINALKENNQVVAMTGDGVNDGPALKAAHIGIAMGKKGTAIAKQAASLILLEDDLSKMVDAVAMGRKIYTNLKKAIQYIISIHIPIILTVFLPLALGWIYPNIFSPVHVIFLEIIMGPTCSIIYENEPIEKNTMQQKPKPFTTTFFNWKELSTSIVQGLAITAGTMFTYQYAVHQGCDEALTRTLTFTVLVASNIFLTLINRSFYYSIFTTIRYKNNLVIWIIGITVTLVTAMLYIPTLTRFFDLEQISARQLLFCISIGFASVTWYELVKWIKRLRSKH